MPRDTPDVPENVRDKLRNPAGAQYGTPYSVRNAPGQHLIIMILQPHISSFAYKPAFLPLRRSHPSIRTRHPLPARRSPWSVVLLPPGGNENNETSSLRRYNLPAVPKRLLHGLVTGKGGSRLGDMLDKPRLCQQAVRHPQNYCRGAP